MNSSRIQHILGSASGKRILVIGDVMLDEFVWGKVSRISPEAPVPVVEVVSESAFPGGAANVARNLVEFAPAVRVMGQIGLDRHGTDLKRLLEQEGIATDCLVEAGDVPTIVKTRIIARHQQVVRVDRERRGEMSAEMRERAIGLVHENLTKTDAIIFEDYGKGLIDQGFKESICALALEAGIIVCVDPNPGNPIDWSGTTVIKPNRGEAFAAAGIPLSDPHDDPLQDRPLVKVGEILSEKWRTDQLLITLGEHGMILFENGKDPYHTPTRAREVFDVSGAGDTAIALYTLALVAGAEPREAAEIANHASGVVVGKLGTAVVHREELIASFEE